MSGVGWGWGWQVANNRCGMGVRCAACLKVCSRCGSLEVVLALGMLWLGAPDRSSSPV